MSSGLFYEGGWSNGKKNGEGLIVYPSGNSFGGNWCNDYREGEGKYWIKNRKDNEDGSNCNQRVLSGVWKQDIMKNGIIDERTK